MPTVLKAASIRQNRDEYRAHSDYLDACRTQTKTGIITFTITERDEQLPSYKYVVRLWSQHVMRDKCHDKNQPLNEHGQVAKGSPLQQQTRLWPAKKKTLLNKLTCSNMKFAEWMGPVSLLNSLSTVIGGQFIHYSLWLTLFCHTCNWSPSPFSKIQVSHKWQMLLQFKRSEQ